MKTFTPALLLLCATALCITSTAGSYNHGHPLLTPSHGQSNNIHKRHIEVNQLRECLRIISQVQCNNGLSQETVNLALQCNPPLAEDLAMDCAQNSVGDYCALAWTYTETDIGTIVKECSTDALSPCTPRCKNLLTLIRSELGCCVNLFFNNSASSFFTPGPFLNSVWTRCGVEPITEQCNNTLKLPQVQVDPTCRTPGIFAERAGAFQCSRRLLQPMIDVLMDTDTCQIYAQGFLEEICGVDESGTPCYEQEDVIFSSFETSQDACEDMRACNPSCKAALQNFANTGGCCINNHYNGTLAGISRERYKWMSSQFWEDCGIETPGLCEARLHGAVVPESTTTDHNKEPSDIHESTTTNCNEEPSDATTLSAPFPSVTLAIITSAVLLSF